MKNFKKIMLMVFIMTRSSVIIPTDCNINMKNSTGYTLLNDDKKVTNGDSFSAKVILETNGHSSYRSRFKSNLVLIPLGGADNRFIEAPKFETTTCPDTKIIYTITLNSNNIIVVSKNQ